MREIIIICVKNSSDFSTDNLFICKKGGGGHRLDFKDKNSRKCSRKDVLHTILRVSHEEVYALIYYRF